MGQEKHLICKKLLLMELVCLAAKLIRNFLTNINYTYFLACFSVLAQIGKIGRLPSVFLLWPQKVSSSYPLWIEPRQVCILYVYLIFTNTLDPWERHRLMLGTFPQSKNSAYLLVGSPYPWFLCVYGSTLIVEPTSECVVL